MRGELGCHRRSLFVRVSLDGVGARGREARREGRCAAGDRPARHRTGSQLALRPTFSRVLAGCQRMPAPPRPERPDIVTRQPVLSLSTATAQPTARCEVWNFASGQGRVPTTPSNGAERSARKIRANARRNGGGSNRGVANLTMLKLERSTADSSTFCRLLWKEGARGCSARRRTNVQTPERGATWGRACSVTRT